MAEGDWIIIYPAILGYLIWPIYQLISRPKKSRTTTILKIVFWADISLSIFLALDMKDMQRRHVTDAGDTIMVIIFVAFLSFIISALTIAVSIFAGLINKYSKA